MAAKETEDVYKVVTANRLLDGAIVYLRRDGDSTTWVESIDQASVFPVSEIDAMMAHAETAAARNIVVAPYAIEITGKRETLSARESIRAHGPSIKFGRDALEPDFSI